MSNHRLIIFDTTMRDGEQSPGAIDDQGREAAHRAGAGAHARRRDRGRLPAASNGDFEAVRGDRRP